MVNYTITNDNDPKKWVHLTYTRVNCPSAALDDRYENIITSLNISAGIIICDSQRFLSSRFPLSLVAIFWETSTVLITTSVRRNQKIVITPTGTSWSKETSISLIYHLYSTWLSLSPRPLIWQRLLDGTIQLSQLETAQTSQQISIRYHSRQLILKNSPFDWVSGWVSRQG